jgi:hypothetical protein
LRSVTPTTPSSNQKRSRASVSIDSEDDTPIFGSPESWQGQFNRDGESLTKMRRISIKHNAVNAKYDSRYRNASNKQQILGRHVVFEFCIFCIF